MITLNLSTEEQQSLIDVLEACLSDLRGEIRKTDSSSYKDMLLHKKETLAQLLEELYRAREETPAT